VTDITSISPRDHFARIVPKWSHFGPPLRPSADDDAAMQRAVNRLGRAAHAVVLGLTPEILACDWPPDVTLSAVDHSPAMIQSLWPPEKGPANSRIVLADWCAMPIPPETIDIVAGDGCFMLMDYPDGYSTFIREVRRVLRPGGLLVIRVFLRPDCAESVEMISDALSRGQIGSVHAIKLRLLAALHGVSGAGSRLDDVLRAWSSMSSLLPAQPDGIRGWTPEEIVGIESYRGMDSRYYLPTLAELRKTMSDGFTELDCSCGRHELADRCPTFLFAANR
jgi:SAM-dependent methyltransferase